MEKMQNKKEFKELGKIKIRDNRNLVISKDNLGFITIAQQIVINEDGRETAVFLKGAIEIEEQYLFEVGKKLSEISSKLDWE